MGDQCSARVTPVKVDKVCEGYGFSRGRKNTVRSLYKGNFIHQKV